MTGYPPTGVSSTENDMKCHKIQKQLSRIFDRGVTPDRRLQEHLDLCPQCTKFWEDINTLDAAFSDLKSIAAPGDLTAQVLSAIRRKKDRRLFILRPAWAGGLAIALALLLGVWAGNRWELPQAVETEQLAVSDVFSGNFPGSLWSFETTENNSN
jgi:predicted anti-sigma-YlaC factor YlaD